MTVLTEYHIRTKALAWTIAVHVLLLLLFIFWRYQLPATVPLEEMGIEVNLGSSDNGYGTQQALSSQNPSQNEVGIAAPELKQSGAVNKNILQSDKADAPSVNTNNRNHPVNTTTTAHATRQNPRYVYHGSNGQGGNAAPQDAPAGNEGNTTGNGDRGVPGGTPGSPNYTGTPGNGGILHTLSDRNIIAYPNKDATYSEDGKVVIRVTVNKAGEIVNKQIVSASSAELRSIALKKCDKVRFNKNEEAPEEQFGNITFVFKTRE